ncbi:MAG: alpha-L-rhamnosidase C-terminal domain-containing protein [Opitutales bacterium]
MLFAPFAGETVCRRLPAPAAPGGTPNMEPRYALDRAAWLWHPQLKERAPGFVVFRLAVRSAKSETVRLQVSADLVYALALDGALVGRGPDTGAVAHWSFATYELKLKAGPHRLEALVWWAEPPAAPDGRMSWRGGFACAGLDGAGPRFTTGEAPWRVTRLGGVTWGPHLARSYHAIGGSTQVDLARFDLAGATWVKPAVVRAPVVFNPCGIVARGWQLRPAALPEQRHDRWHGGRVRAVAPRWTDARSVKFGAEVSAGQAPAGWDALLQHSRALRLPARHEVTVLVDTDDYLCGFPLLEFSGGADTRIRVEWAESLFDREEPAFDNTPGPKGDRGAVAGKTFFGFGDTWKLGGRGRRWASAPWWRAGRYLLVSVKVGAQPVVLHTLGVERTGFPLATRAVFDSSDASLPPIMALGERGLRACLHDIFVDCPYYEQMMYVADSRIQMLLTYVMAGDDRLARRGMELFDLSRGREGYPAMRYPSVERQESATFALIWPWMLHDFALWRDDPVWLRERLPGLRALMEALATEQDAEGLLARPPGWLFADCVPGWEAGWAPGQREGRRSALVNLQYLRTLQCAADLETWVGDPALAQRWAATAQRLGKALERNFWSDARGLWANDDTRQTFSQHAQALAVLGGLRAPAPALWADAAMHGLAAATFYFQHYLFEALGRLGRPDLVLERFEMWRQLVRQGFMTPVESPEPARSDCHAWGAHPVFHLHATIAGVRPAAPGFRRVRLAPQPGPLTRIETSLPHPRGPVRLRAAFADGKVEAEVELPPGTDGVFVWRGRELTLAPGRQVVRA